MKKRTPAKPEPLPEAVRDALFGGRLAREAKQVRAGKLFPSIPQLRIGEATANFIRDGIQEWLKSGDFGRLAALLEEVPQAIVHPAVVLALRRLAEVRRRRDPEEGGYSPDDEEDPLPDGARQAADDTLRAIACAVVSGLFERTGWTVQPPPAKPGRPGRSVGDMSDIYFMLFVYEEFLEYVQRRRHELRRRTRETRDAWLARLTELIREAWLESSVSIGPDTETPSKSLPKRTDGDIFDYRSSVTRRPLGRVDAQGLAKKAAGTTSASPAAITSVLIGHYFNVDPDSVRHRIAIARK
jgi:hypothetical protein